MHRSVNMAARSIEPMTTAMLARKDRAAIAEAPMPKGLPQ